MNAFRYHRTPLLRPAAAVLLVAVAPGCTMADRSRPAASGSPRPAVSSPPGSHLAVPARLSCEDGTGGVAPPSPGLRRVHGLTSDGWPDSIRQPAASAGSDQAMFWKAFLYVTADAARWTTVTVAAPATAHLYYVPFEFWSSGDTGILGTEDTASGQQAITFESCPEQPYGYTGGVTTREPACVTLTVHADGRPDATVRLPLGVPC